MLCILYTVCQRALSGICSLPTILIYSPTYSVSLEVTASFLCWSKEWKSKGTYECEIQSVECKNARVQNVIMMCLKRQ